MKKLSSCALLLYAFALQATAQIPAIPEEIDWQGYLTDGDGPVTGTVNLTFRLYDTESGGTALYTTPTTSVVADNGVVNVELGPFSGVSFDQALYLGISVNGSAELVPRTALHSVPYAYRAKGLQIKEAYDAGEYGVNVLTGWENNSIAAGVVGGTISGGGGSYYGTEGPNTVAGDFGTVAGGFNNTASGNGSTVSGGWENDASVSYSTVCGGIDNTAIGGFATVAGGLLNTASGESSFAAGTRAQAIHDGAFVWADYTNAEFPSTGSDQFLIRATGGVGIGTNTPANPLSVNGNADFSGKIGIGTNAPAAQIHMTGSNESPMGLKIESIEGDRASFYFITDQGIVIDNFRPSDQRRLPLLLQATAGKVGIGTFNPTEVLEVDGNVKANNVTVPSDARFKKGISTIDNALSRALQLRGVSFSWRGAEYPDRQFGDGRQFGLIAQEVREVLPEVVTAGDDGMLSLSYQEIIPVLIEAIKEQQAEIVSMKVEIAGLRDALR